MEAEFAADAERQLRALHGVLSEPALGAVLVARRAGRVVGSVMLLRTISTALGREACWLEDLVVADDQRGLGVGRALVEAATAEASSRGWARITLVTDHDNAAVQRLYERAGFERSSMVVFRKTL